MPQAAAKIRQEIGKIVYFRLRNFHLYVLHEFTDGVEVKGGRDEKLPNRPPGVLFVGGAADVFTDSA
ncbi:hypothetical protein [uncultured Desulfovibrio sp.]|uniref:hypothetical protein n=1 Tax=uncultured Desulfovibrio sp. TaxID=167968 RepID=UPI0026216829|nr:hypothetical protein [uncultured Desulfovibrio sp.]